VRKHNAPRKRKVAARMTFLVVEGRKGDGRRRLLRYKIRAV